MMSRNVRRARALPAAVLIVASAGATVVRAASVDHDDMVGLPAAGAQAIQVGAQQAAGECTHALDSGGDSLYGPPAPSAGTLAGTAVPATPTGSGLAWSAAGRCSAQAQTASPAVSGPFPYLFAAGLMGLAVIGRTRSAA